MSFIPRVTCRRCGRQYSGLRGRCPYCGTRRVKQSDRVPATSAGADPATPAGERAASNSRWQLIFGGILLLAVILAVVVLVSISLNGSTAPGAVNTPVIPSMTPPAETQPIITQPPVETPSPQVDSVTIYVAGQSVDELDGQFAMNPDYNGPGNTQTVSVAIFPATVNAAGYIEWSSSDPDVISVTPNEGGTTCTLTQLGEGTIAITVTVFGVSDSVTVFALNMPS